MLVLYVSTGSTSIYHNVSFDFIHIPNFMFSRTVLTIRPKKEKVSSGSFKAIHYLLSKERLLSLNSLPRLRYISKVTSGKCCSIPWNKGSILPVVDTIFSGLSPQSCDRRLVLPEPVRPMQTKSYSGRGGGGPLQQSALKHCQDREKQRKQKQNEDVTFFETVCSTKF